MSKSVLQAIESQSYKNTHHSIYKIKNGVLQMSREAFKLHFVWVPIHCIIEGNEYVDSIAVKHNPTDTFPKICPSDLKQRDKSLVIKSRQGKWNASIYGRRFYSFSPTVNRSSWFQNIKMPRNVITTIIRLRFGHNQLKYHLHKINITSSDRCDCGAIQTMDLITFFCPDVNINIRLFLLQK